MELSILCDCEISLIIFNNQTGKYFQYCSSDTEKILLRYVDSEESPVQSYTNTDYFTQFEKKDQICLKREAEDSDYEPEKRSFVTVTPKREEGGEETSAYVKIVDSCSKQKHLNSNTRDIMRYKLQNKSDKLSPTTIQSTTNNQVSTSSSSSNKTYLSSSAPYKTPMTDLNTHYFPNTENSYTNLPAFTPYSKLTQSDSVMSTPSYNWRSPDKHSKLALFKNELSITIPTPTVPSYSSSFCPRLPLPKSPPSFPLPPLVSREDFMDRDFTAFSRISNRFHSPEEAGEKTEEDEEETEMNYNEKLITQL